MVVAQHVRVPVLGQVVLGLGHVEGAVGRPQPDLRVLLHQARPAPVLHVVHQLDHGEGGAVAVQRVVVGEAAGRAAGRVEVGLLGPAVHRVVRADVDVVGGAYALLWGRRLAICNRTTTFNIQPHRLKRKLI